MTLTPWARTALALIAAAIWFRPEALAGPLNCSLEHYKTLAGLTAAVTGETLTMVWDGEKNQEVRLRLAIDGGTPTIRELAVRRKGAAFGGDGRSRRR